MQMHLLNCNKKLITLLDYKLVRMSLLEKVEAALDTIRPYLLTDGGNVLIEEITNVKHIYNIKINSKITDFFIENSEFIYLKKVTSF